MLPKIFPFIAIQKTLLKFSKPNRKTWFPQNTLGKRLEHMETLYQLFSHRFGENNRLAIGP